MIQTNISDLEAVQACQAIYNSPATLPIPITGAYVRVTSASDGTTKIVTFRGSITVEDWVRDFFGVPVSIRNHPQLGRCHAGFLDAAQSIAANVADSVGSSRFILTGHSLGGAVAVGVAGLLVCSGIEPSAVVTFGAPRFGMMKFVALLASYGVRQYVRGTDLVPDLPEYMPPLFPFMDTRDPRIPIGAIPVVAPAIRTDLIAQIRSDLSKIETALASHHIDGYVTDVEAYLKQKQAA